MFALTREDRRSLRTIVLSYAVIGSLWIYLSDAVLSFFVKNPATMAEIATYKGIFFILFTASVLYLLVGRNLSRLSEAYQQMQTNQERFRMLVEESTDITFSLNGAGVFTYVSPNWQDAFGYELSETVGKPFAPFVHPDDVAGCYSFLQLVMKSGEKQRDVEYRVLRKDGSYVWYSANGASVLDPITNESSFLGVGRDISRQKQSEALLSRNEAMLKESQRVAQIGHYELDLTTNRWTSSEELDQIFGIDDDYPRTTEGWCALVSPNQRDEVCTYVKVNVLQQHEKFDREYAIVRPNDHSLRWVHGLGRLEFDGDGKVVRMFGIIQDISKRKRLAEVLSFLATASVANKAEPFFNVLARYLARSLGMDAVAINRLDADGATIRTVVCWADGRFRENVTYTVPAPLCVDMLDSTICWSPAEVHGLVAGEFAIGELAIGELSAESYLGVTLLSHTGRPMGFIFAAGRQPPEDRKLAEEVLQMVAVRAASELERLDAEEVLQRISITDDLTALNNRRGFMHLAKQQAKVADRSGKALSLVYVDIDRMKWINDTFSHSMGDLTLVDTAEILRKTFRASDIIARIGGDEFVVLSLEAEELLVDDIRNRLLENLNSHNLESNRPFQLSLSYGITTYDPASPCSIEELLERGDLEMYRQKQKRRIS